MPDIRINRISVSVAGLGVLTLMLFLCDIGSGAVAIPVGEVWKAMTGGACDESVRAIILDIRLVKALVALMAGAALSVSGLQMQTLFRNPLAGPYVLGISSGASLGVALFVLGAPLVGLAGRWMWLGSAGAAWLGSVTVLVLVSVISARLKDIMVVLILGMMFSSGIGAIVQILQFLSREDALKSYVIAFNSDLGSTCDTCACHSGWTCSCAFDCKAAQYAFVRRGICLDNGAESQECPRIAVYIDNASGRYCHCILRSNRFHRSRYATCGTYDY